MIETLTEIDLEQKSLAWIIRYCVDNEDFSCVVDSSLEDKKKLYIAYGVIYRTLVKTGIFSSVELISPKAGFSERSAEAHWSLFRNKNKIPAYLKEALDCAETFAGAGILCPMFLEEKVHPNSLPSVFATHDGARALAKNIERVADLKGKNEPPSDFANRVVQLATQAALATLESNRFSNATVCPITKKIVGEPALQKKGIWEFLLSFFARSDEHFKPQRAIDTQTHLGCPAVHAGVFKELVETAVKDSFKVSRPVQPDD